MEKETETNRTPLWNEIHAIVKQIPREDVSGDAMDAPSAATEIEELFQLKTIDPKYGACWCGNAIDTTNPDCIEFALCKIHASDA